MPTLIEWTDETWNPVTGCEKISPGCTRCYAKQLHDRRHKAFLDGKDMPQQYSEPFEHVHCHHDRLETVLHWRAPRLCFVNSGADLFHDDVDFAFLGLIYCHMAIAEHITFQALTKRPTRMLEWYLEAPKHPKFFELFGSGRSLMHERWPLPNFWPGVSVEHPKYLWRLDTLRQCPAPVRMVSFEPLVADLGKVNLEGIGWVIVGGESGPGARPMHPAWVRSLLRQCLDAGVPFFFKQWGEWMPHPTPAVRGTNNGAGIYLRRDGTYGNQGEYWLGHATGMDRVGKKKAGRLLDGRIWDEFPKPYPGHHVVRLKRRLAA